MSAPDVSLLSRIEQLAKQLDAWGCTSAEVDAVRRDQGVALPHSYEALPRHLGRDGGGLFGGTAVCYPDILGLRQAAIEELDEYRRWKIDRDVFVLPDDAVVISMHQGYAFEFVRSSHGDDPPVEWWSEGTDHPERSTVGAASIVDWLEAEANSSVLPPKQQRARRLSAQGHRRRLFEGERCPSCGGELRWSGVMRFAAGDSDSGRERSNAFCAAEAETFWRWADEPTRPLQPGDGS